MKGIKFYAAVFDISGYASWARSIVLNTIKSGIPVCLSSDLVNKTDEPIKFQKESPRLNPEDEQLLRSVIDNDIDYDYNVCILTPEAACEQMQFEPKNKIKVCLTLWETDRVPKFWISYLSTMDEIWVPGVWNKDVFYTSFVESFSEFPSLRKVKLKTLEYPFNHKNFIDYPESGYFLGDPTFKFYYISQWTERKNFKDLIEAFLSRFSQEDNVSLVIKTYINDHSQEDREKVREEVKKILSNISSCKGPFPRITLIHSLLSEEELNKIHSSCHCYVSPSRGEGIGLGIMDAIYFENPVITHSFGEHGTVLKKMFVDCGYSLKPVTGMSMNHLYTCDQNWATIPVTKLADCMYEVYSNYKRYKNKSKLYKEKLMANFSSDSFIKNLKRNIGYRV